MKKISLSDVPKLVGKTIQFKNDQCFYIVVSYDDSLNLEIYDIKENKTHWMKPSFPCWFRDFNNKELKYTKYFKVI